MPPRAALPLDLELDRDGAGRVDGLRGPEKCGASRAPPPDMGAVGSGAAGRTTLQRDEASCDLGGAAVLEELVGGTEGVLVNVVGLVLEDPGPVRARALHREGERVDELVGRYDLALVAEDRIEGHAVILHCEGVCKH